ncbi:hypothetical protein P3T16_001916 [Paraburkholderia sp. GAS42]
MRRLVCCVLSCVMCVTNGFAQSASSCGAYRYCPPNPASSSGGSAGAQSGTSTQSTATPPQRTATPPQPTAPTTQAQSNPPSASHGGSSGSSSAGTTAAIIGLSALAAGLLTYAVTHSHEASAPSAGSAPQPDEPTTSEQVPVAPPVPAPVVQPVVPPALAASSVEDAPAKWGIVPKLSGITVPAARRALTQNGLQIAIETSEATRNGKRVATQSIMPGEHVPPGTVVSVTLKPPPVHAPAVPWKPPSVVHVPDPIVTPSVFPVELPASQPIIGPPPPEHEVSPSVSTPPKHEVSSSVPPLAIGGLSLFALAGALVYGRKHKLRPKATPVYRVRLQGDFGSQTARVSSRRMRLPAVDVRLASDPWDAHMVSSVKPAHR